MIIRQAMNFGAHFLAGVAIGALVIAAVSACRRREDPEPLEPFEPEEPAIDQPT